MPAWRVDRSFDYLIPKELEDTVRVGSVVRARFGGRNVRGVVVELRTDSPNKELNEIGAVVLPFVAPESLIRVLRWIAHRYVTQSGKVFARVVPPRVRVSVSAPAPIPSGAPPRLVPKYEGGTELIQAIESGR